MSILGKSKYIQWMKIQDDIGEPPWDYDFLLNLDESEYPKYLAKIFKYRTGEKLPLKFDFKIKKWIIDKNKCKTFNQKIQWIKLYGITDLMRMCTDKVAVRDYVKEKIGEEYLKPVLQVIPAKSEENSLEEEVREAERGVNKYSEKKFSIQGGQKCQDYCTDTSTYFDQIDFEKLPNAFVIKCNHGCKWQYIVKNKEEFLNTKPLFELVKRNMTGWLEQEYWVWGGFEMQYKGIEQKILIEKQLKEENNIIPPKIEVFCFSGNPKIVTRSINSKEITFYDENLNITEDVFGAQERKINYKADDIIKQSFDLSKKLSKEFKIVRVDWTIYKNKLYFEELTFTPHSGFCRINNNLKLGNWINL